jgi:hypothetical protein
MVGGLFTSFLLELLVYPAVYFLWRKRALSAAPETCAITKAGYRDDVIADKPAQPARPGAPSQNKPTAFDT